LWLTVALLSLLTMADQLSKALMLDKIPLSGKAVVVVQHNDNDSSPFLHALLAYNAKQNRRLCIVSLNHTANYFHSVGSRLGWNLQAQKSNGNLIFISELDTLKASLQGQSEKFAFMFNMSTSPLENLLSEIEKSISSCWSSQQLPFTLVIDEMDCLLSTGVPLRDVMAFYQRCHSLTVVQSSESSVRGEGALIVSLGCRIAADVEATQLANLLSHWSDLVLTEKGLETGRSKDLSGSLSVHWNISTPTDVEGPPTQHYQFKCFDRGIRCFAPGTSAAVL